MKRLFLLMAFMCALGATAQTYTYRPLALDTSCFWLSEFLFYDGGYVCQGQRISVVTGDTLIGGYRYHRIFTYSTEAPDPPVGMCNAGYLSLNHAMLVREDTVAKKLYGLNGSVLIDFDLAPGDTMANPGANTWIVDSASIESIMGIDRRVQWTTPVRPSGFRYQTIEGIGMTYNFPVSLSGEWGIPAYRLQCYSKGGQVLYTKGGAAVCARKPQLSVSGQEALSRAAFSLEGNRFRMLRSEALPLTLEVFDMTGRRLRRQVLQTGDAVELEAIPGNYVLRLSNARAVGAFVVYLP